MTVTPISRNSPSNATGVISMEWEEFSDMFEWEQGEHIACIGPTGSGKTTLSLSLLDLRDYVVAIGTKPKDRTLAKLKRKGYVRIEKWDNNLSPVVTPRRILWPNARDLESEDRQRKEIGQALKEIYAAGDWCVYIDELWYFIHILKFERTVRTYLLQSRSIGISLVVATQRPAFIPLEVYDQCTHLFFWRDNDERNLSRISGISWLSANLVRTTVANLKKHEVLYINTRDGLLVRTMPPPPPQDGR